MKAKLLLFSLTICISYGSVWAQPTSYGVGAGNGGNSTNSYFGEAAGSSNTNNGDYNTFIGHDSGFSNTNGTNNTFLGNGSGRDNISGSANTFIGVYSGYDHVSGNHNTFVGVSSGFSNQSGTGNVFLGRSAGASELGSNRLYIDNSGTSSPLIWGDFAANALRFHGTVRITNIPHNVDNDFTQILVSSPAGDIHWRDLDSITSGINTFPSFPDSAGDNGDTTNAYFGHEAGLVSTGSNNTFIGYQSGSNNTAGYENSALGSLSLSANTVGSRNTANGIYALSANSQGNQNTAVGYAALGFNDIGNNNTAIGYQAGINNAIGSNNTYIGINSGFSNQGSGNVFIGHEAGYNEAGDNMLYIDNSNTDMPLIWGDFAGDVLQFNATVRITDIPENVTDDLNRILAADATGNIHWRDVSSLGSDNLGDHEVIEDLLPDNNDNHNLGSAALAFSGVYGTVLYATDALHLGADEFLHRRNGNVALGDSALSDATVSGTNNTAIGTEALRDNTNGGNNTAMGENAMAANKDGGNNTALGHLALSANQGGDGNVAVGRNALSGNGSGSNNVAVGENALQSNVIGDGNVAIGYNSGPVGNAYNTVAIGSNVSINGDNAIAIGLSAAAGALNATAIGHGAVATGENSIALGNGVVVTADDQIIIGNFEVEDVMGAGQWTTVSDGRFKSNVSEDVSGLDFINALRPVSYQLNRNKIHTFMKSEKTISPQKVLSKKRTGFIAQEVEQLIKDQGYVFTGIRKPRNENDHYGIRYAEFVVPLTRAVQELSALVEAQRERIEVLEGIIGLNNATSSLPNDSVQHKNTTVDGFALYQNIPNPFDKSTTIEALVPESVQKAKIIVYNLQGLELESYPITGRGNTSIEISAGRFPSGMYLYALIADGQIIDTKKMILTK